MSHEAIYALIYGEKPRNSFRNWEDRNMSEPTLEEKLRAVFAAPRFRFSINREKSGSITQVEDLIKVQCGLMRGDFYVIDHAINWLYETAKRERYLG